MNVIIVEIVTIITDFIKEIVYDFLSYSNLKKFITVLILLLVTSNIFFHALTIIYR